MKIKYIASFDSLRGIAVMSLMLVHGSYGLFGGGIPRVDLFYLMSGFLITYLLFYEYNANGEISFGKFYARRALRLLPALFICIILCTILWPYTTFEPESNQAIATISSLFFFNNLIHDSVLGSMHHLWSLSVEEHFYLIWPILASLVIFRLENRQRIVALAALLVAIEIFRIFAFIYQDQWQYGIFWVDPYGFTLCRIDCIVIGSLLFFILYTKKFNYGTLKSGPYDNVILIALAVLFLTSALTVPLVDDRWLKGGFILSNLLCTITVIIAIRNPNHPVLTHKSILWIGRRSYGIYLYHVPIFMFLERFRTHHDIKNLIVITFLRFSLSIALAAISYRFVELPVLEYKKTLSKVSSNASTVR